jgi:hypothetical protein
VSVSGAACFAGPSDPVLDVTTSLVTVADPEELLSPQPASRAAASSAIRIVPATPERSLRNELIKRFP